MTEDEFDLEVERKKYLDQISTSINNNREDLKNLEDIQNELDAINKSIKECVNTLSKSVTGQKADSILSEIISETEKIKTTSTNLITDETNYLNKNIDELVGEMRKFEDIEEKEEESNN